jgi:hypothetical protein
MVPKKQLKFKLTRRNVSTKPKEVKEEVKVQSKPSAQAAKKTLEKEEKSEEIAKETQLSLKIKIVRKALIVNEVNLNELINEETFPKEFKLEEKKVMIDEIVKVF